MKRSNRLSYSPVNLQDFTGVSRKVPIEGETRVSPALEGDQRPGRMVALPAESDTSMTLRARDDCSTVASSEPASML